ncbi:MAG: aryl-sulfate sulfotransferase, partial [Candidatus Saccharibacteria bacterium]|nr:aryl-sulfate sulfotransferase [Candidatus Saccharibacteria bacterium]
FDNGNNKSKIESEYVPAERSYSRGVMYKIDEYEKKIEQVWEYGKERGAEFYSPYISDVDYLDAGHYIVHSGGIVYKDGKNSNQPAGFGGADKLVSDTVELKDDKVIFEIVLPTNTYRVEKLPAYTKEDLHGVSLGGAMRVGSLGKTEIAETKYGLMRGIEPDNKLNEHNVSIIKQEDRLVFNGTFKRSSNVRVVLVKGLEQKDYKMRITDKAHAALCVAVFEEEENADADDITVTRFINSEGLDGKYDVYLEVYDKIYNLHQQVSF